MIILSNSLIKYLPVAIFRSVGMLLNDTVFFRGGFLLPSLHMKLLFRGIVGSFE